MQSYGTAAVAYCCLTATLSLLVMVSSSSSSSNSVQTTYTTKYDNIDVDAILASNRLLKNYVNCLLDTGPCTAEGKELKKYVPDAIATGCSKCSDTQKKTVGKVLSVLQLRHSSDFDKLAAKYDPDGMARKKYFDNDEDYSDLEEA